MEKTGMLFVSFMTTICGCVIVPHVVNKTAEMGIFTHTCTWAMIVMLLTGLGFTVAFCVAVRKDKRKKLNAQFYAAINEVSHVSSLPSAIQNYDAFISAAHKFLPKKDYEFLKTTLLKGLWKDREHVSKLVDKVSERASIVYG